jgi:hypothetical protein
MKPDPITQFLQWLRKLPQQFLQSADDASRGNVTAVPLADVDNLSGQPGGPAPFGGPLVADLLGVSTYDGAPASR